MPLRQDRSVEPASAPVLAVVHEYFTVDELGLWQGERVEVDHVRIGMIARNEAAAVFQPEQACTV